MTPITYEQATEILEIADGTIQHAASRGVLTRLPREGLHQHLIKEQVELFKGKKLSKSALTAEEHQQWQQLHDAALSRISESGVPQGSPFRLPMMALLRKKLQSFPSTPRLSGFS